MQQMVWKTLSKKLSYDFLQVGILNSDLSIWYLSTNITRDFIDVTESNISEFYQTKPYSKQTPMEHTAIFSIIVLMTFLRPLIGKGSAMCQTYILDCKILFGFAGAVGCIPSVTDSPD